MTKQGYRYRVTGTMKFMVDDIIDDNEQDIRDYIADDPGGNVDWAKKNGDVEILELNLERLEPREMDDD